MNLSALVDHALTDPVLAEAVLAAATWGEGASAPPPRTLVAPAGFRPIVLAALARHHPVLAVTSTSREAEEIEESLAGYLATGATAVYPSWETLPHERLSPRPDTVGRRVAVLRRLRHPEEDGAARLRVVVAPVRSLLQPQVSGLGDVEPLRLTAGGSADLETVVERLVYLGYQRSDLVERRGEFAVRGGLLDCFPPTEEHPLRVEFFGDDVEEVRAFSVADQRSLAVAPAGLLAPPCRELLLTPQVRRRAAELAESHPELADVADRLAAGDAVEGMEALAPVLAGGMGLLLDELAVGTLVVVVDPERVRTRAVELVRTGREFLEAGWANAAAGGVAPVDLEAAAYRSWEQVQERAGELRLGWWRLAPFGEPAESVAAAPVTGYRGDRGRALRDIAGWLRGGARVVLVAEGHGPAARLAELLASGADAPAGTDVAARAVEDLPKKLPAAVALATTGCQETGFLAPSLGLYLVTERDLAGQRAVAGSRAERRMPVRRRSGVDPLVLVAGDLVVHETHGVARYVEMVRRSSNGGEREYMVLEYAKGDRLYLPSDALDLVTRYVGGENPSLSRLGGGDWAKTKGRARKAVRQIAAELIRLYSARMSSPGRAFSPDTPWQRELEDAFPYRETPDQLAAVEEVKADMERPVPMDRVVCGDVGYGKTEIAIRAAFKAVQDGVQVAVLVPTTLLAQQHLGTFSERFAAFPVTVRALSRFSSAREAGEVLAGLADGNVDVVIGTHRLLSPEVRFRELGLVVVDEEQRFGVEHKEHLKRLRTSVDVLSMSATPIPRTLEMSITGIREMSTILTPPEQRHPVLTVVSPYDDRQVIAAIRRELLREGQVFYIHNRVESIDRAARRVRELVPEARVAVAHGQLPEEALERIMLGFWEREFDVLVCTTIVENGLDVSNANTMVVERADMLGLSQLHQLRGRVGRSRERGYAYFLYPPERPLSETANDRLATVAQHADLGAGMAVAMKDLQIRGAGNLLGGEQSGHIAGVGFDLYVRMVGEAVAEFRGDTEQPAPEVKVELPIDAHLPHDYVPAERLRLAAYRRLSEAVTEEAVTAVREELRDRFGPLPPAAETLLAVAHFRVLLRRHGVTEVTLQGAQVRFAPLELRESQQLRLARLYPRSVVKQASATVLVPRPTATGGIAAPPLRDIALLDWCVDLLRSVHEIAPAPATSGAAPT